MGISKKIFGQCDAGSVYAFTLSNDNGLTAEILNYGGIIRKLVYKDVDVVLGRESMEEYLNNTGYYGAIIGRNSNRIENAEFTLNGKVYKLFNNNGRNNIHGGKVGFDKKIWEAEMIDAEEPSLVLSLKSPDGEEGFPGTVSVKVTYTLTKDNGLTIHYVGESDADTVLNMTNHSYFNLNGHGTGTVEEHLLWVNSDFYTPNTEECMPTGEVLSVKNSPFDFTTEDTVGSRLSSDHQQIKTFGGFDHNFVLNGFGYRKVGRATGDKTGIVMEVYTDQKGMQIFSKNFEEAGNRLCKDGAVYCLHGGLCFETQAFPNSTRFSHFPGVFLKKGEIYDTTTTFRFM